MKVFLNAEKDLLDTQYVLFKNQPDQEYIKDGVVYSVGQYSIQTQGKERNKLILITCIKIIFTLGLILFSATARANLQGKRIDMVFIKTNKPATFKPKEDEPMSCYRIRIYNQTEMACKKGYLNKDGIQVDIDNKAMLAETETYADLNAIESEQKEQDLFATQFTVLTQDTFEVLLKRKKEGVKNPVGINMANAEEPGGGVGSGCAAQEEALCRRSNHIVALKDQHKQGKYPLPEFGGIYCPHVQVFRDTEQNGYAFMDQPEEVNLVAVAAYNLRSGSDLHHLNLLREDRNPEGLEKCQKFMDGMKNKIRNMLRIVHKKGHTHLVLGALGCGAFANPPTTVAKIFKEIFNEKEFKGRFQQVDFAILELYASDRANVQAFRKEFEA